MLDLLMGELDYHIAFIVAIKQTRLAIQLALGL